MDDKTIVKITSIITLGTMSIVALHYGIDHTLQITISAIIGGIAGYHFKLPSVEKK